MAYTGRFSGGEHVTTTGTPAGRADREKGIELAPLTVRQWTEEERERYLAMPPPPEIAAKARRKAQRERRDAEMGVAPEIKAKGLQMLAEGSPVSEVAKELGVSDVTVYDWRKKHADRIAELKGGGAVKAIAGRIEALIVEGRSPEEIRKQLVVARNTFDAAVKRLGVEWINDQWESVGAKAPDTSTQDPNLSADSQPERTSAESGDEHQGQPAAATIGAELERHEEAPAPADAEPKRELTEGDLREAIREAIVRNDSLRTITADLAAARGVVDRYARELGYAWDGAAKIWTPIAAERPVSSIDDGIREKMAPAAIAKALGCSEDDVAARAGERELVWDTQRECWMPEERPLGDPAATGDTSARAETPRSAEDGAPTLSTAEDHDADRQAQIPESVIAVIRQEAHNRGYAEGLAVVRQKAYDTGYAQGRADEREQTAAFTAPKPQGNRPMLVKTLRVMERVQTYEADIETEQMAREVADWAAMELAR